jgi:hypothetical protein
MRAVRLNIEYLVHIGVPAGEQLSAAVDALLWSRVEEWLWHKLQNQVKYRIIDSLSREAWNQLELS